VAPAREVVAQRLHERLVGHHAVLVRTPEQDRPAVGLQAGGRLGEQAGLADPRVPGQQHEPAAAAERACDAGDLGQLALPAGQRRLPGALERGRERHRVARSRGSGGGRAVEPWVLLEDLLLEPAQLGARRLSELAVERVAQAAVCGQRLGLPAAAIQREHQVAVEALAQRMLVDEPLEPRHGRCVVAERELRLQRQLERLEAALGELRDVGLRERRVAQVGQRILGAPQGQRVGEQARRRASVARAQALPPRVDERAEAVDVELVGLQLEHVGRALGLQDRVRERPPQTRDVDVDGLRRLVRTGLGPQHLDELLGRDGLVAVEQERGQELSRLAAADRERLTGAARHERAEEAELDAGLSRRGATLQKSYAALRMTGASST
jgi:hypothetical protein